MNIQTSRIISSRHRKSDACYFLCFLFAALAVITMLAPIASAAPPQEKAGRTIRQSKSGIPSNKTTESVGLRKRIELGEVLYKMQGCSDCHLFRGAGCKDGVVLDTVRKNRDRKFVLAHLRNPEEHVAKNPEKYEGAPSVMPFPNLSEREVQLITDYLFATPRQAPKTDPGKNSRKGPHKKNAKE